MFSHNLPLQMMFSVGLKDRIIDENSFFKASCVNYNGKKTTNIEKLF